MRCALIIPYYGKLPEYFQLFLDSCAYNKNFTWFLFTDDQTKYSYPNNVYVKYMTFEENRILFQHKLGNDIVLNRPYKLCDYRPTYGYVYYDYIKDYEYWGHCDIDLLFGDLAKTIIPLMELRYDKIFAAGHLTIYRNIPAVNSAFKLPLNGEYLFYNYSKNERNYGFDEDGGNKKNIHRIFLENGFRVFSEDLSYNCSDKYYHFCRCYYDEKKQDWCLQHKKRAAYFWSHGSVKEYVIKETSILENEYIYIHFQGRKNMRVTNEGDSNIINIQPFGFVLGVPLPTNGADIKRYLQKPDYINDLSMFIYRLHLLIGKVKVLILKKVGYYDT